MKIHPFSVKVKILSLLLFSLVIFNVYNLIILSAVLLFIVLFSVFIKWPKKLALHLIKAVIPFVLFFIMYGLFFQTWQIGLSMALRLLSVTIAASLFSATTSSLVLIEGLEQLLSPLGKLKINYKNLSFGVWMALRFIPLIHQNMREIREAQQARGIHKNIFAILIPLLIKTLKTAEAVALAVEVRGIVEE